MAAQSRGWRCGRHHLAEPGAATLSLPPPAATAIGLSSATRQLRQPPGPGRPARRASSDPGDAATAPAPRPEGRQRPARQRTGPADAHPTQPRPQTRPLPHRHPRTAGAAEFPRSARPCQQSGRPAHRYRYADDSVTPTSAPAWPAPSRPRRPARASARHARPARPGPTCVRRLHRRAALRARNRGRRNARQRPPGAAPPGQHRCGERHVRAAAGRHGEHAGGAACRSGRTSTWTGPSTGGARNCADSSRTGRPPPVCSAAATASDASIPPCGPAQDPRTLQHRGSAASCFPCQDRPAPRHRHVGTSCAEVDLVRMTMST